MVGIRSFGTHIPMYRLNQDVLAKAWGGFAGRGEKAVANYDEDTITMAVISTANCLAKADTNSIQGLNFASTTSPYQEKLASSVVATAADFNDDITVSDFANSVRSGTIALRAAIDAIRAGSAKNMVVVAADCRLAEPGSLLESQLGDGSAALLIGETDVAVNIEASFSVSQEFLDIWRKSDDTYINTVDDHFIRDKGYLPSMEKAIKGVLSITGQSPADFTKVIFTSPDRRSYISLARKLGLNTDTKVQDPLFNLIGNCGVSHSFLMLIAALEEADPGDTLLFVNYGDGADAFSLKVTDNIEDLKKKHELRSQLNSGVPIPSYERYLRFRNLLLGQRALLQPYSSVSLYVREQGENLRFHGVKCKSCSLIQYPRVAVCRGCGSREFEEVKLGKNGKIFTFTSDYYYPCADPPLILANVDLAGGGKLLIQMTDREPNSVEIGMDVEMVLRNYHQGKGFNNYSWKCRPLRS